MASWKLEEKLDQLEQELESIPIPDGTSEPRLRDDFKFDEVYYDDVIRGYAENGGGSSAQEDGWRALEVIARTKIDLEIQNEAGKASVLMAVYKRNIAFLKKSLTEVIESIGSTADKILKLHVTREKKVENWLTAALFGWIFLGATYFFYTLWRNTFLPNLNGIERLAPLLLCGLLVVPADIMSKLYYKHPEYQKPIEKGAFWGTFMSVGLILLLFGVARGLGEVSASLIQAESEKMGFTPGSSGMMLATVDPGFTVFDWIRICIYTLLPIGEMCSATYLLIFIRASFQEVRGERQLSELMVKQRKLNRHKTAIERKIAQLCQIVARCENFDGQKSSYIDYNLKLIEARYRGRFGDGNGSADWEVGQVSGKEEILTPSNGVSDGDPEEIGTATVASAESRLMVESAASVLEGIRQPNLAVSETMDVPGRSIPSLRATGGGVAVEAKANGKASGSTGAAPLMRFKAGGAAATEVKTNGKASKSGRTAPLTRATNGSAVAPKAKAVSKTNGKTNGKVAAIQDAKPAPKRSPKQTLKPIPVAEPGIPDSPQQHPTILSSVGTEVSRMDRKITKLARRMIRSTLSWVPSSSSDLEPGLSNS